VSKLIPMCTYNITVCPCLIPSWKYSEIFQYDTITTTA
jgi:hypothetical protein